MKSSETIIGIPSRRQVQMRFLGKQRHAQLCSVDIARVLVPVAHNNVAAAASFSICFCVHMSFILFGALLVDTAISVV